LPIRAARTATRNPIDPEHPEGSCHEISPTVTRKLAVLAARRPQGRPRHRSSLRVTGRPPHSPSTGHKPPGTGPKPHLRDRPCTPGRLSITSSSRGSSAEARPAAKRRRARPRRPAHRRGPEQARRRRHVSGRSPRPDPFPGLARNLHRGDATLRRLPAEVRVLGPEPARRPRPPSPSPTRDVRLSHYGLVRRQCPHRTKGRRAGDLPPTSRCRGRGPDGPGPRRGVPRPQVPANCRGKLPPARDAWESKPGRDQGPRPRGGPRRAGEQDRLTESSSAKSPRPRPRGRPQPALRQVGRPAAAQRHQHPRPRSERTGRQQVLLRMAGPLARRPRKLRGRGPPRRTARGARPPWPRRPETTRPWTCSTPRPTPPLRGLRQQPTRPMQTDQTPGAPKMAPVERHQAMWVSNTDSQLLMRPWRTTAYYALFSGPLVRPPELAGPWA